MRVGEAATQYLASAATHMADGSIRAYRSRLLFLCSRLGDMDIAAVTLEDIERVVVAYRDGRRNSSTRLLVSATRGLFDWLVDNELLDSSPAARLRSPKREQHVPRALSVETMHAVLQICDAAMGGGWRDIRNATLIQSLLLAGLRRAEGVGLNWRDVDMAGAMLVVFGKGSKERRVPMHARLKAAFGALRVVRRGPGAVFTDNVGQRISLTNVNQHVFDEWLCPRLGQHVTPHQLRHTFATRIVEGGGSLDEAMALLGHASVATTQIYVATSAERLREAVERL